MSEDGKLTGHSALIAGSTEATGFAIAKLLAAEGCDVHLADGDETALMEAYEEIIECYDVEAEEHPTDLSDSINAAALALECEEITILVNTFGSIPDGSLEALESEQWMAGFEMRVFGAINLCREVMEGMIDLGSGVIVNVGVPVVEDNPEQICAVSANAALLAFSNTLDKQSKPQGIRVLSFFPEPGVETDDIAAALSRLIFSKISS